MWEFLITLWCGPRWQFRPNLCPKKFLLLNFTRILWFFWDLGITLFDIYEDSVFAEIFILGKFFGFPGETWTPKWTKTVNFGCFSLESKFKILKNFSNTVFVLLEEYPCSKFQQDQTIFGGVRVRITPAPPFPPKRGHFMDAEFLTTSQPQLLFWWNLLQNYILIRSFIWQNRGA